MKRKQTESEEPIPRPALFTQAVEKYEAEDYSGAISLLEQVLIDHIDEVEPWNVRQWMGMCCVEQRQFELALEHYRVAEQAITCTEPAGHCFHIYEDTAYCLWKLCKYDEACSYFERAEPHLPAVPGEKWSGDRYLYRLNRGRSLLHVRGRKDALEQFKLARCELDTSEWAQPKDYALIDFQIGQALLLDHQPEAALPLLRSVDENLLSGHTPYLLRFALAMTFFDLSRFDDALVLLEQIDPEDPAEEDLPEYQYYLGMANYRVGNLVEAHRILGEMLQSKFATGWVREYGEGFLAEIRAKLDGNGPQSG